MDRCAEHAVGPVKTRRFFSLQPSISISTLLEAASEELEGEMCLHCNRISMTMTASAKVHSLYILVSLHHSMPYKFNLRYSSSTLCRDETNGGGPRVIADLISAH